MRLIKFLLFLVALASCYNSSTPEGYKLISTREALSSPQILSLIEESRQVIIEVAMRTKSISRDDFNLSQINIIYQRADSEQYYYKSSCDFQSLEGSLILSSFDVKYNPFTTTSSVTSYSFKLVKTLSEMILNFYKPLNLAEIDNRNEIEKVAHFGLEQIVKRASWEGKIFASYPVYEITSIKSVSKQISGRGIFYKCVINFAFNQDKNIETKVSEANFTVYYQPHQDKYFLLEF